MLFQNFKLDNLDLSKYDGLIIEYILNSAFPSNVVTRVYVTKDDQLTTPISGGILYFGAGTTTYTSNGAYHSNTRDIQSFDDTGISFGGGATNGNISSTQMYPLRIYGVKGKLM